MVSTNGAFPLEGAGRFGAGSEGAVLLKSVTCRVSTTDNTGVGVGCYVATI